MTSWAWTPSKWLLQTCPPDASEGRGRWTFGLFEILDRRRTPIDPRVLHTIYRGVVELDPEEVPDAQDPLYTAKLQETVVEKYKRLEAEIVSNKPR